MTTANLPAIRALRPAWNKGRIVGQKRPLKPKHVWAIRVRLELAENHRDLALFNLAIDSKLRGCDLVRMKVVDIMASGLIKERASVLQSKTHTGKILLIPPLEIAQARPRAISSKTVSAALARALRTRPRRLIAQRSRCLFSGSCDTRSRFASGNAASPLRGSRV